MSSCSTLYVMNCIISCVRTEDVEHACVVVADSADMELLGPSFGMVHTCKIKKNRAAELEHFLPCRLFACEGIAEDLVDFFKLEVLCIECLKTMV